jgi:hypothetical protein
LLKLLLLFRGTEDAGNDVDTHELCPPMRVEAVVGNNSVDRRDKQDRRVVVAVVPWNLLVEAVEEVVDDNSRDSSVVDREPAVVVCCHHGLLLLLLLLLVVGAGTHGSNGEEVGSSEQV